MIKLNSIFAVLGSKKMKHKKKVLLVFGTRPEAIKMAPLVKAFQQYQDVFTTQVCVTAQHRQMLDQVLSLFDIQPDFDLNIMQASQDLYDITVRVLIGLRDVYEKAKPDIVLVHGDTSTSTAAALAAFYKQIPVGHVEAGLRTHNIYSPWPEEMNRQLTGRLASYHFAPSMLSKNNLINEGINESTIFITGNTVIDALYWVLDKMKKNPCLEKEIISVFEKMGLDTNLLQSWISKARKLVLITGHRRENFGQGFINICEAIKDLANKNENVDFVYPMHLNPNVRNAIIQVFGSFTGSHNIYFIEPLDYLPFIYLMDASYIVLTDSGGIQEEAPGLGKPVLVMRDTTERPEALSAGTVKLVGTDKETIIVEISRLLEDNQYYNEMSQAVNPYGDGNACKKIAECLLSTN